MNAAATRKQPITREELSRAIAAFRARGGLIRRLPAEKVVELRMVGRRWSRFEEIIAYGGEAGEIAEEPAG